LKWHTLSSSAVFTKTQCLCDFSSAKWDEYNHYILDYCKYDGGFDQNALLLGTLHGKSDAFTKKYFSTQGMCHALLQ
jgi:hypothetical protein